MALFDFCLNGSFGDGLMGFLSGLNRYVLEIVGSAEQNGVIITYIIVLLPLVQ